MVHSRLLCDIDPVVCVYRLQHKLKMQHGGDVTPQQVCVCVHRCKCCLMWHCMFVQLDSVTSLSLSPFTLTFHHTFFPILPFSFFVLTPLLSFISQSSCWVASTKQACAGTCCAKAPVHVGSIVHMHIHQRRCNGKFDCNSFIAFHSASRLFAFALVTWMKSTTNKTCSVGSPRVQVEYHICSNGCRSNNYFQVQKDALSIRRQLPFKICIHTHYCPRMDEPSDWNVQFQQHFVRAPRLQDSL